jgi:hypothetical protein
VDPYRAPQPLPPPPPDAMRPVLIGAGLIAGLIAAAAVAVYVSERFGQHKTESPPIVSKPAPLPLDPSAQAQPERAPRKWDIPSGIIIDGAVHGDTGPRASSQPFDFSFAVFPVARGKRALTAFKTNNGHYQVELLAGRSYDLCWGGDPEPVCNVRTSGGRKVRVRNCPATAIDCSCAPANTTRFAWPQCERVRVDSVTHVYANVGMAGPSHIAFRCEPADACTKADVIPDELK